MESSESSSSLIPPSLQALLHEIIDYAGVFPPADLSLRRAIENYHQYRNDEETWMLSRFVLPVRRLPDLNAHRQLFKEERPYQFSVLGTGGGDVDTFLNTFGRDVDVVDAFDAEHAGRTQVDIMEVPLPEALVGRGHSEVASFLDEVTRHLVAAGTAKLDLFFEVPVHRNTVDTLPHLCAAVAEHNSQQAVPARTEVGLKVRCGGAEPSDVPDTSAVAHLVAACRNAGVPFKATAGLHHPVRHYDDGLDTELHGFLNIFAASVLAAERSLDVPDIEAILREDDPDNFRFLKNALAWRDLSVSLEGIRHARNTLALSFGSCSFEEPIDHLRDLELL